MDKVDEEKVERDDDSSASSDEEAGDNHEVQRAKSKKRALDRRLMDAIGQEQGTLHYIQNKVNGTAPRAPVAMVNSVMTIVGPTLNEQVRAFNMNT